MLKDAEPKPIDLFVEERARARDKIQGLIPKEGVTFLTPPTSIQPKLRLQEQLAINAKAAKKADNRWGGYRQINGNRVRETTKKELEEFFRQGKP